MTLIVVEYKVVLVITVSASRNIDNKEENSYMNTCMKNYGRILQNILRQKTRIGTFTNNKYLHYSFPKVDKTSQRKINS